MCSVYEINCFKPGITGEVIEIANIIQALDAKAVNYLIVPQCSALSVPADIRRFPRLLGLQFYNTTFVDWARATSVSLPYLNRLDFVYIVRSRFLNGIPEGLTYDIASNVQDLEREASDIGNIPDNIHEKWSKAMVLLIEHCNLQNFPRSFTLMGDLVDLSLVRNNISSLPESRFASFETVRFYRWTVTPLSQFRRAMAQWRVGLS